MGRPGSAAAIVGALLALGCSIDRRGGLRGDGGAGGDGGATMHDGCTADLENDVLHCGACGNACTTDAPNASPACIAAACGVVCDAGFGDCDGDPSNGCEASLADAATCGSCDVACTAEAPFCDGGACGSTCTGGRQACGMACVDVLTDPSHCGDCNLPCTGGAHQSARCDGGTCLTSCESGWGECNADPLDGCEQSLDDVAHCSACFTPCDVPGASETCPLGTCTPGACDPGLADCDLDPSNGCETSLGTPTDCGACGVPCAPGTPLCDTTGPAATCVTGCGDTEMLCGDTCVLVDSDPSHCGSCGAACGSPPNATATCAMSACALECAPGYGDCNGVYEDGCEAPLTTVTDCTACGASCMPPNARGDCSSGRCRVAECDAGFYNCNGMPGDGCEATAPCCSGPCDTSCGTGECCTEVCADAVPCARSCSAGCTCLFNCVDHDATCATTCAPMARCNLDCTRGTVCTLACDAPGARCLIDCTGAATCNLACPTPLVDCGAGIYACNRTCP